MRCRRYQQVVQRGLMLMAAALLVSVMLPGARLSRLLLSEDAERQRLVAENERRLEHSQHVLRQYRASVGLPLNASAKASPNINKYPVFPPRKARPPEPPPTRDDSPKAEVGVTILTMARGRRLAKGQSVTYKTQYLTQSLATVLELLNDTSLTRTYTVRICNIDDHPKLFSEAKELEDVAPMFKRYALGYKAPVSIWEKLKLDYVYCLQQTLGEGVQYALLVEDDAVAHPHLFKVLEHVLHTVVEAPGAGPVAYLKLYHPVRLLGYISLERERLTELVALGVVVGAVLTLACGRLDRNQQQKNPASLWLSWLGWGLVVVIMALAIGRANLLELRRLSPQLYQVTPTPSCCAPGLLHTRDGGLRLSRYLLNVTCTASRSFDIKLDDFRTVERVRALMIQPNLFSHIGLLSSLRTKEVSPLVVQ